jgi:predicted metal-dependent peptidase
VKTAGRSAGIDLELWLDGFLREASFIHSYPFYAAILSRLTPVHDPSVERMAVSLIDSRFYLHINVDSFVREPQYIRGVLLHEVHHIALGHLSDLKFANAEEPEVMDLALEMSANEYIEEPLPNPIVWSNYAKYGLRAGESTLTRYEKLRAAAKQGKAVGSNMQNASKRSEGEGAAPRRVDDHRHLGADAKQRASEGAAEHVRKLVSDAIQQVQKAGTGEELSKQLLVGKNPGCLLEELSGGYKAPEVPVDWKNALSMFVAKTRAPAHTWSRPNRRFPNLVGVVPGRAYASRATTRPKLNVVIDTSQSMMPAELDEIARHLGTIAEHAQITIVECDTECIRTYAFTGHLADIAGRGGTDLRPPFEASFLSRHPADGLVYFTDGDGPFHEQQPSLPVLWVLTKRRKFACLWGERTWLVRGK